VAGLGLRPLAILLNPALSTRSRLSCDMQRFFFSFLSFLAFTIISITLQ